MLKRVLLAFLVKYLLIFLLNKFSLPSLSLASLIQSYTMLLFEIVNIVCDLCIQDFADEIVRLLSQIWIWGFWSVSSAVEEKVCFV